MFWLFLSLIAYLALFLLIIDYFNKRRNNGISKYTKMNKQERRMMEDSAVLGYTTYVSQKNKDVVERGEAESLW